MMLCGLSFAESTIRSRIWPSGKRAPTPVRSGARSPWKRSSGNGPLWHSRHKPTCRLATIARPRDGSPLAPVSEAVIESSARALPAKNENAIAQALHQFNAVVLQRHRADALAGRLGERVQHRRRRDADRRLADAAPDWAARGHEDGLHLRHLRDAHRVVLVEVRLLDAPVLHRALLEEQCRQAVDEGARDLALDLRRVHGVAGVGGGDDAVHLDLVAVAHRDFAGRGDEAVEAMQVRKAAIDAAGRWLAPADLIGHRVQHAQIPWMFRHKLAPELERILAGRVRELVHEALDEQRVLVDVDAAPETRRHVGVAHRVVDQQVRHGVAERVLARLEHALEAQGVAPLLRLHDFGTNRSEDRLAREAHVQPSEVAARVQAAGEPALHHWVVLAVRHVLLARPEHLHRGSGHLLGDEHRLPDVVVRVGATPSEAAAQHDVVHVDLVGREARGLEDLREGAFAVLRRAPHLAALRRPAHGRVHRLHAGVVLVWEVVRRLDFLRRAGERGLHVAARLVADEGLLRVQSRLEDLRDARARHLGVLALVPDDRQLLERGLGVPPGVGDHRDAGVADLHHFLHAGHAAHLGGVEALHLAAEHRAVLHRRVQHTGELDVDAVHHGAVDLPRSVEALQRLARDLPGFGILERNVLGLLEARGGFGHLAVGRLASRGLVRDDAVRSRALGGWNFPLVGCGFDEHHARGGSALAHILVRLADAAAAARGELAPGALARDALAGRRVLDHDLVPVAIELLGHELGEAGERALAHFGADHADGSGVVRADHHPDGDFGRAVGRAHDGGTEGRKAQAQREAATNGGAADEEGTTRKFRHGCHGRLPHAALAAMWIASRTCWKVPQRQMLVMAASMSASLGLGFVLRSAATAMIMPDWQ